MFVTDDSKFEEEVPIQLGTTVIDEAFKVITDAEWRRCGKRWEKARLCTVISQSAKVAEADNSVLDLDQIK